MTLNGWIQILVFCGIVILLFNGERTLLSPLFVPVERGLYRLAGTHEKEEQHWTSYGFSLLLFNLAGFFTLYLLQRFQGSLPFNPAGMTAVGPKCPCWLRPRWTCL